MQHYPTDVLTGTGADAQSMRDSLVLHIKQEDGLMGKHCSDGMANGYGLTNGSAAARDAWAYRDTLGFRSTPDRTASSLTSSNAFGTQMSAMDWGGVGRAQSSQYYSSSLATQPNTYSSHAAHYGWDNTHTQPTHPFSYGLGSTHRKFWWHRLRILMLQVSYSLSPGKCGCNRYLEFVIFKLDGRCLGHFLWNYPHVNATRLHWLLVNFDSVNGLSRQAISHWLTNVDQVLWCHMTSLVYDELMSCTTWLVELGTIFLVTWEPPQTMKKDVACT